MNYECNHRFFFFFALLHFLNFYNLHYHSDPKHINQMKQYAFIFRNIFLYFSVHLQSKYATRLWPFLSSLFVSFLLTSFSSNLYCDMSSHSFLLFLLVLYSSILFSNLLFHLISILSHFWLCGF